MKLKKSTTENFKLLPEAYGEDCIPEHAGLEGRESVKDDDRPGRPRTAVFFDIQCTVMAEWVPSGQTVNQQYYIEVSTKLPEHVRRKRLELWRKRWILNQDNAPVQNALSVKQFLDKKSLCLSTHPIR